MKRSLLSSITTVCLLLTAFAAHSQTALYVDSSKASSGAGTSWATAYKTLSEALARANSTSTVTDVYVAKGTYIPATASGTTTTVKDSTFPVKPGLSLFGGYPSGGSTTASPGTNPTVLSGNNNNYHVLAVNSGSTLTDTISGFVVTGGLGGATTGNFTYGSIGSFVTNRVYGGAFYIAGSTVLQSCVVTGNVSNYGAGVYVNAPSNATLTVSNCSFTNDSIGSGGSYGGAIYMNAGSLKAMNTLFAHNNAIAYAGAIRIAASGTNTITNCTFVYNTVTNPVATGAGSAIRTATSSTTTINNCVFWGNSTQATALTSDVIGNGGTSITVNNSIGQDVPGGNSNISNSTSVITGIDPQLNSATDYTLFTTSPAINTGSNTLYTGAGGNTSTDVDVAGKTRVYNAVTIDMGAYEYPRTVTTWNGTAWSNGTPGTYSSSAPPSFDVIIASNTAIPAAFYSYTTIINSGAALTSSVSRAVYTYGDIYNNGNGSSGFYQWFMWGSCTLHGNPYRFGGAIYLNAANITFNTNNGLVLSSDATSTGEIYTITSGSAITGTVTQERYIPASNRKNYTLVSSPVSSPTIYNAWQEAGASTTGYGTWITGPTGSSTADGFDATSAAGIASIYTYNDNNATGSKWVGLTNTNATTLAPGKGFLLYVRGDRTVLPGAGSSSTTLRATGTIATSNVDLSSSLTTGANKFSLVANPFTISINWNTGITKTNLTGSFTVYDANNAVFITSDGTTRSPSITTHQSANYLQNGQAFFVQNDASGNAPGLIFTTATKTVAPANGASVIVFGAAAPKEELDVNVYSASNAVFADGAVAVFGDSYLAGKDSKDAGKMTNFTETFALLRSNETLSIEGRPMVKTTDTLFFSMAAFTQKQYTMVINGNNFAAETATLIDRFTNTSSPVNLRDTTRYTFSVTADAASAGNDRFMIVLNNAPLAVINPPVPATGLFVKLSPNPVRNQLQVSFQTATVDKTVIHIINSLGQTVKTIDAGTTNAGSLAVDMSQLDAGVYLVQLVSGNEKVTVQKIVKE